MDMRHFTPPAEFDDCSYEDLQCPGGTASTNTTYFPKQWSPQTNFTATTPPRSPMRIRECGSRLLPKPRYQDQLQEPTSFNGHNRTTSLPCSVSSTRFGSALPQPREYRRSTSPYNSSPTPSTHLTTPSPAPVDHLGISRPSLGSTRSVSASHISSVRSHSRHASSNIDASMLSRYGYPTYRQSPTPQPSSMPTSFSRTPNAMNHLAPIIMPGGRMQSYPSAHRTASPPARPSRLSVEAELAPGPSDVPSPTSTVLDYLTAPNPTPSLIQRITEVNKVHSNSFWFDIRNVRTWSDFNVETISSIPGLLDLLNVGVSVKSLPKPGPVNLHPETNIQLAELCAMHHAVKVNAALHVSQGTHHIAMRSLRPAATAAAAAAAPRSPPEFVANYRDVAGEKTFAGDARARVVGIVRSYHQWNSGYRHGSPVNQIRYLDHLAALHRHMRDHGTRYGFLMTEIEIVCVRAGGPPPATVHADADDDDLGVAGEDDVPLFGYVEVAAPIPISAAGRADHGGLRMTAGLALWYLHLLAKEQPFPGQFHWRVHVGGPAALTRRRHLPRDEWMPKANLQDKRVSHRVRGWMWPDEPLHKRECGKGGRRRK